MAVNLVAWGAAQVLPMHAVERQTVTVPDPYARWRDLTRRDGPTATYRRGRCGQCRDDGTCELLDVAQEYADAAVFPLLPAEEVPMVTGDSPAATAAARQDTSDSRVSLGVEHTERVIPYPDPAALFASTEQDYLRYRPAHPPLFMDWIADLDPPGTVLDLGCGPGSVALALAQRGRDVIGMDANPRMLDAARQAATDRLHRGQVTWRIGDAHNLADLPPVAGATIADAFHWFDRARVLRELDRIVVPGGFVALVMSFAAGTPKPWWYPLVDRMIIRHLGASRRAGPADLYRPPDGGDHETVLRTSAFDQLTVARTDHPWCLVLEQVIGHQYTQAYSSPAALGERLAAFDRDLRVALHAAEPSGAFTATVQPALIIARRREDM